MVFKIFLETSAIDHHFLTLNLRSIIDHKIWVSKLVNGLQNFSRNFSDRSLFFNTKFVIDHQIWVSKPVNGLQNFSRNFRDRSPFLALNLRSINDHQIWVWKLVNGLQNFSRNIGDRSRYFNIKLAIDQRPPNLSVKTCKWSSKFLQKL